MKKHGSTWVAAMNACPKGWRLPTDQEWDRLIRYLGGEETAGELIKSTIGWPNGSNGTNASGFTIELT